jgi:hypothetical protein
MFNQIFSKKVIVPFFQFVGIIAIFTFIVFPGLTAADTIVNIFSAIIGFFTLLALYYFVKSWFTIDESIKEVQPGETELDYVPLPKPKVKRKPKSVVKIDFTDAKGMNEIAGVINPIAEGRVKVSVQNPKVMGEYQLNNKEKVRKSVTKNKK